MANRTELFQVLGHEETAWTSPTGISECTGFEAEELTVDPILIEVLSIFDEGQRLANDPYDLLDQKAYPTPYGCSNDVCEQDYTEDSRP